MWFLLRCAFCLAVVYGSILSAHGTFSWEDGGARAIELARGGTETIVEQAASHATAFCARHAGECLVDAARLTTLFRAAEPEAAAVDLPTADEREVPLPVPDPRRRYRDAKLTQAPQIR